MLSKSPVEFTFLHPVTKDRVEVIKTRGVVYRERNGDYFIMLRQVPIRVTMDMNTGEFYTRINLRVWSLWFPN